MWFDLRRDERVNRRCATEGCGGQPIYRLEADGVGSDYCSGCRAKIEQSLADDDARLYGIGFTRRDSDGRVERIAPDQVFIHGNSINYRQKD